MLDRIQSAPKLIMNCINILKSFADFDATTATAVVNPTDETLSTHATESPLPTLEQSSGLGMNLSYTINLNLPATSDIAVFNSIFKSLRENLLSNS